MTLSTRAKERPASTRLVVLVLLAVACAVAILPAPARAADPVVAAAGNIACDPASPYFAAGAGTPTRCRQAETAALLPAGLAGVLTLGDAQYCCGSLSAYTASYEPTWGQLKAVTHPVLGNRDYTTAGAAGYFDYFNGPGACGRPGGQPGPGLLQLRPRRMASHRAQLELHPRRLLGRIGAGALAARRPRGPPHRLHACLHARRALQLGTPRRRDLRRRRSTGLSTRAASTWRWPATHGTTSGSHPRPRSGAVPRSASAQFVVGTGGHSLGMVGAPKKYSEVRQNTTFGVLELTLRAAGYSWRFIAPSGASFSDSGSGSCHGAPPPRKPRKKPKPKPKPGPAKSKSKCTVLGTPRNDVLRGTRGRDVHLRPGGQRPHRWAAAATTCCAAVTATTGSAAAPGAIASTATAGTTSCAGDAAGT